MKNNSGDGIQVIGNSNLIEENHVDDNGGDGVDVTGNSNTIKKSKLENDNAGNGIRVSGSSNTLPENDVFDSGGDGIDVTGNLNTLAKNDVGDRGKGNGLDGVRVAGYGNLLSENNAFANGGDGFEVSGGTSSKRNVLQKNLAGDANKGNGGNGFLLVGVGNGNPKPIELEENTARKNALDGIKITGTGWQLKKNLSGGSASQDNGDCEFRVVAGNFNATSNKANNTTIASINGSAFPTGCKGTA